MFCSFFLYYINIEKFYIIFLYIMNKEIEYFYILFQWIFSEIVKQNVMYVYKD